HCHRQDASRFSLTGCRHESRHNNNNVHGGGSKVARIEEVFINSNKLISIHNGRPSRIEGSGTREDQRPSLSAHSIRPSVADNRPWSLSQGGFRSICCNSATFCSRARFCCMLS